MSEESQSITVIIKETLTLKGIEHPVSLVITVNARDKERIEKRIRLQLKQFERMVNNPKNANRRFDLTRIKLSFR